MSEGWPSQAGKRGVVRAGARPTSRATTRSPFSAHLGLALTAGGPQVPETENDKVSRRLASLSSREGWKPAGAETQSGSLHDSPALPQENRQDAPRATPKTESREIVTEWR